MQGQRSLKALEKIISYFGVGKIYRNRRRDNHKEDLFMYKVTKREDLAKVIIPFFKRYKLYTSKLNDFMLFSKCVGLMQRNTHLVVEGMVEIARLTKKMNHKKSRDKLIKILRDYTPNSPKKREDIVPSA